jgi:hypothetical protein
MWQREKRDRALALLHIEYDMKVFLRYILTLEGLYMDKMSSRAYLTYRSAEHRKVLLDRFLEIILRTTNKLVYSEL